MKLQGCVKMNKKKITIILSILLGTLLTVFAMFTASAYTDGDPLITLSYLQEIFAPTLKQQIIDEVNKTPADDKTETSKSYELIELTQGNTVLADSICEFIVRPGSKVTAVSPFPSQGIADITKGIEVMNGEAISINSYCLIPRGKDGRGIKVVGEKAYIMIRGDYTIG